MFKLPLFMFVTGISIIQLHAETQCPMANDCLTSLTGSANTATDPAGLCHYVYVALDCLENSKQQCLFDQQPWITHKIEDINREHRTCDSPMLTPSLIVTVLISILLHLS